jgi:SMODS-associated and fused to various effectors sensor domain
MTDENLFWEWLGRISDSLGTISVLITLIFSGLTYFAVKRQRQKMLETIRQNSPKFDNFEEFVQINQGITSEKPVALIISVTQNKDSAKPNVETFFKAEKLKMPTKEVTMNGLNNNEDIKIFIESLNNKKREIQAEEFTEVHLFINAPIFACVQIGSILKNLMPIKIYHFNSTSAKFYEYKTPLV